MDKWAEVLNGVFPSGIPITAKWESISDIINILNLIGKVEYSNHLFFPSGGGDDLSGADISQEFDCLELCFGSPQGAKILKAKQLSFELIENDISFSYFRLETKNLSPSSINEVSTEDNCKYEELTELEPGIYTKLRAWMDGYYLEDGEMLNLPSSARRITRYLNGSFVILPKSSLYNQIGSTYDARHNNMSEDEFKSYMIQMKASANKVLATQSKYIA
jgi:hypothetical protein